MSKQRSYNINMPYISSPLKHQNSHEKYLFTRVTIFEGKRKKKKDFSLHLFQSNNF